MYARFQDPTPPLASDFQQPLWGHQVDSSVGAQGAFFVHTEQQEDRGGVRAGDPESGYSYWQQQDELGLDVRDAAIDAEIQTGYAATVLGNESAGIVCFDVQTGEHIWEYELSSENRVQSVAFNDEEGLLYASYGTFITCLDVDHRDVDDVTELWTVEASGYRLIQDVEVDSSNEYLFFSQGELQVAEIQDNGFMVVSTGAGALREEVHEVVLAPNEEYVLAGSAAGNLATMFDLQEDGAIEQLWQKTVLGESEVAPYGFDHNTDFVLLGIDPSTRITVVDIETGDELVDLNPPNIPNPQAMDVMMSNSTDSAYFHIPNAVFDEDDIPSYLYRMDYNFDGEDMDTEYVWDRQYDLEVNYFLGLRDNILPSPDEGQGLAINEPRAVANIDVVEPEFTQGAPNPDPIVGETTYFRGDDIAIDPSGTPREGTEFRDIVSREWTIDGGEPIRGSKTQVTWEEPGIHTVEYTVTDNWGAEVSTVKRLYVAETDSERHQPPEASIAFGEGNDDITPGSFVTLDGSESVAASGVEIAFYEWNINDWQIVGEVRDVDVFAEPGLYLLRLEVTDEVGASDDTYAVYEYETEDGELVDRYGLTVTDPRIDTKEILNAEIDKDKDHTDLGRIFIRRDELQDIELREGVTEVLLMEDEDADFIDDGDAIFGGVVYEVDKDGAVTEIVAESFEWYAKNAEPADPSEAVDRPQAHLAISFIVDEIEYLTRGAFENAGKPVNLTFSNDSQAKKMRSIQESVGYDLVFNPDKSVDFVKRRGQDRTSVTLAPENRNVENDFTVQRQGSGDDYVTHIRVVGAGEGEHQVSAERVVDWYTDDLPKSWEVIPKKDLNTQSAVDSYADTIKEDYDTEQFVQVTTTVSRLNEPPIVGDQFTIKSEAEDLDPIPAEVVDVKLKIEPSDVNYKITLSTRRNTIKGVEEKTREDTQAFNTSVQGAAVPINAGGGRQPVDGTKNYQMRLYYPQEVFYEHRLNIRVVGLPYRAYSGGAQVVGGEHVHVVNLPFSDLNHLHVVDTSQLGHDHNIDATSLSHSHSTDVQDIVSLMETLASTRDSQIQHYSQTIANSPTDEPISTTVDLADGGDSDALIHVNGTVVDGTFGPEADTATVEAAVIDPNTGSTIGDVSVTSGPGSQFSAALVADRDTREDPTVQVQLSATDNRATVPTGEPEPSSGTSTLTVTVEDESGNALGGAEVQVDGHLPQTTDSNGQTTYDLADDTYQISADADGYDLIVQDVTVSGATSTTIVLPEEATIQFQNTDVNVTAIADHAHEMSGSGTVDSSTEDFNDLSTDAPAWANTEVQTDQQQHTDAEISTEEGVGDPNAPPDPGIVEDFDGQKFYPSNCQVIINDQILREDIRLHYEAEDEDEDIEEREWIFTVEDPSNAFEMDNLGQFGERGPRLKAYNEGQAILRSQTVPTEATGEILVSVSDVTFDGDIDQGSASIEIVGVDGGVEQVVASATRDPSTYFTSEELYYEWDGTEHDEIFVRMNFDIQTFSGEVDGGTPIAEMTVDEAMIDQVVVMGVDANGEFAESAEIIGQLEQGEVNRIEIMSNSLGHMSVYVEGDVYRQITGQG